MNRSCSCLFALRNVLAGLLLVGGAALAPLGAQQPPPPPLGLDQQEFNKGSQLSNEGKFEEAAKIFAAIPLDHPTSAVIPEATLKLGYVYFRMNDFDRAVTNLKSVPTLKGVPPEVAELALSLVPQVLSAKAAGLPGDSPARKVAFEDAAKQFDVFLQKYPNSDEVENANYGKAVALYQVARYKEAGDALKANLQKFPGSETVLDSQYLLALTMGTQANAQARDSKGKDPAANTLFDNAGKMLGDVIKKGNASDVSIANDARTQVGEVEFSHAAFIDDKEQRKAMLTRALDSFRQVLPKEIVVLAQKSRIEAIRARQKALVRDPSYLANFKHLGRVIDKEEEKLAAIEGRPEQTLAAKIKMAQIFLQLERADEARVVLGFVQQFAEDEEQKKQIAYYTALSLAAQNMMQHGRNKGLADKTFSAYTEFRGKWKADPIAENLAIVVGAGFVQSDPQKAISLFHESAEDYPQGKFLMQALAQEASALVGLGQFDEALKSYRDTLAKNPEKEVAAMAEFGIATILQKTDKVEEAIAAFKEVRDKYAGLPQAEQAAFWHAQMTLQKGDAKEALSSLDSFLKTYPSSELTANAQFYLAQAESALGKTDKALATYQALGEKFPQAEVAPFSYFARAQLYQQQGKMEEMMGTYRSFIKAFPDSPQVYQAYDAVAQIAVTQKKEEDGIASYEDFVKSHTADPNSALALLRVAGLYKALAEKIGRYSLLNEDQRKEWAEKYEASIKAAERVVQEYPESPQVALALQSILESEKQRLAAKLVSDADIEKYFGDLAEKYKDKPATRSKIVFTLASNLFERDKAKAISLMAGVYDAKERYAPADLDLYGSALLEQQKFPEAKQIYEKLAADYSVPKNIDPTKAQREVQDAQAMSLFGLGKVLEVGEKNTVESRKKYDELERLYGWSPKRAEASYGIALSALDEKNYEDATRRLVSIVGSNTASPELRAKGMLLLGRVHEDQGHFEAAIDSYVKISNFYSGVPAAAAEGLWRGANLLERQGNGSIPMPTPKPVVKPAASPAKALVKK